MSFRFKPEDFRKFTYGLTEECRWAAGAANEILDQYLKTLPEVLGVMRLGEMIWQSELDRIDQMRGGIKRARLWGVEEIKSEPCKHDVSCDTITRSFLSPTKEIEIRCDKCGKRLVAKWE